MDRVVRFFTEAPIEDRIREISIVSPSGKRVYSYDHVKIIREISEVVTGTRKEVNELEKRVFQPKCHNFNECSRSWTEFIQELKSGGFSSTDPIKTYVRVLAQKRVLCSTRQPCLSCRKTWISSLEIIRRLLVKTILISRFLKLKLNYDETSREMIYSYFLKPRVVPRSSQTYASESTKDFHLAEEYTFGPYSVSIMLDPDYGESFYSVESLTQKDDSLLGILEEVVKDIRSVPQVTAKSTSFLTLDELLQIREQEASRILLQRYPELPKDTSSSLAELICYESIGIGSVSAFLTDENVEEFFIDQPGVPIYLDHRNWGRCRTNVTPPFSELKKIETRLRTESGFRLDRLNPSIKTEISTRRFAVRASIDISPLAADGFHLDVRKLGRNRLSLAALVENETLSSEAAAYLYFCLLRKVNIIAVGEPGSGKTTMINALDLLTPSSWRKITIEDAIESIPQREFGKHQVRLKVEPFEERRRFRSKSREIISLLHRTPDLIYLGEIQTASHSKAMFHALSAGLTGLQTCHAYSPEQALVRWVIHHNVPPICLRQIGIIIHMRKLGLTTRSNQKRKVVRLCEVKEETDKNKPLNFSSSSVQLVDVFRWDPLSDVLKQRIDLFETPALQSIKEYEALTRQMFEEEIYRYRSLFNTLAEIKETDIHSITKLFSNTLGNRIEVNNKVRSDHIEASDQSDNVPNPGNL
jgi:Flp pilus assembly CpaF family ATPase